MAIRKSSISGIPFGNTASRPANPEIGATYNNGTLGIEEIYTSAGWVAKSAPAAIPTSVIATNQPTGRAYNNGQASVAFSNGEGGGLVNDFIVTPSPATSPATFTGSSSPIIVTGLQSSQQYTYTLQARNNFGTSLSSAASAGVTATTVPQAPTLTAEAGDTQITITITPGATGGSAITQYTITSSPATTTVNTSSTTHTFTGLTNGTTYTFTATATNANGISTASSASNSVTPADAMPLSMNALVIAGGGACVNNDASGGGGGAGGVLLHNLTLLTNNAYTVVVGGGCAGGSYPSNMEISNGTNSYITGSGVSITQSVGGGYGAQTDQVGGNGGSGGGNGGRQPGTPGQPTSGQGNAGGIGNQNSYPYIGAGGGGGAGGAGSPASSGGHGGAATSTYSTWASHTSSGVSGAYAGGGGGGSWYGQTPGNGGGGGAGNGINDGNGQAGSANTGSGAGGGNRGASNGAGGSGIIILRYTGSINAVSTTGSPSRYETGGYTYYKFNNTGSITF